MRFVTFDDGRGERVGALLADDTIVDLVAAQTELVPAGKPLGSALIALLEDWGDALPTAQAVVAAVNDRLGNGGQVASLVDAGKARLLAPVPRPPRLRDYLTYEQHAAGSGMQMSPAFEQMPIGYKGNPYTVVGHEAELLWPAYSDQLDFELELGFYVAGSGVDLSVREAAQHIAGVTIFNDVSARDIQLLEMSMMIGPSKSKDFCNVMGPCMTTIDELDEYAIELIARVNGEEWARGTSAGRRYSFAEVLAWASYAEPVVAGEFLAVGTVGGGCGLELDRWLQPGDVLELEASGIGVLRNTVGAKQVAPAGAGLPSYRGAARFVPRVAPPQQ